MSRVYEPQKPTGFSRGLLTIMLYGGCSNPSSECRLADESSTIIPTLAKGETDV